MINSIIYKEWIKSYKIIYLFAIIIAVSIFGTYLNVKNAFEYNEATDVVLGVIYMGRFDFSYINYILPIFAIILGVAQFYPEIANARIRLYLHLPMSALKLESILIFVGFVFLMFVCMVVGFLYYAILTSYFPDEVFWAIFSKLYPMFLTSILCYLTTILAFLEPKNKRKIVYILISYFVLNYYMENSRSFFVSQFLDYSIWVIVGVYILSIYDVFDSYTKGYVK